MKKTKKQLVETIAHLNYEITTMRTKLEAEVARQAEQQLQERHKKIVALEAEVKKLTEPVPMILFCPMCGERHIDQGVFPHRAHACQECGFVWSPALIPTYGVRFLPGCKDAPPSKVGVDWANGPDQNVYTAGIKR